MGENNKESEKLDLSLKVDDKWKKVLYFSVVYIKQLLDNNNNNNNK